ncbi:MAG TPA: hypothetical protein VFJ48_10550 [Casimicrobiaceae bacterium]|nr:hypothetical protein [Casimicrobiaceae bacterium]
MNYGKSAGLVMALALAAAYTTGVAAQASPQPGASVSVNAGAPEGAHQNLPDMRLWSFGECDNKFPYFNSAEHKECVRVVGSDEARDARAYRVCETSNPRDPEEVARCKSTYKANKDRSAQSGYVPNAVQQKQAAPTAEDLERVRAIASVAVENDKARVREGSQAAAVAEPIAPAVPEREVVPEEPEGPPVLAIVLSLFAVGGGTFAFLQRRRHADIFSTR